MKIYGMLKKVDGGTFLGIQCDPDVVDKHFSSVPDEGAKIVQPGEDKDLDTLYAVEFDTDDYSTDTLMEIMFTKLSLKEVKEICNEDSFIKKLFENYLCNPMINKEIISEIKKELKKTKSSADSASGLAAASLFANLL